MNIANLILTLNAYEVNVSVARYSIEIVHFLPAYSPPPIQPLFNVLAFEILMCIGRYLYKKKVHHPLNQY